MIGIYAIRNTKNNTLKHFLYQLGVHQQFLFITAKENINKTIIIFSLGTQSQSCRRLPIYYLFKSFAVAIRHCQNPFSNSKQVL